MPHPSPHRSSQTIAETLRAVIRQVTRADQAALGRIGDDDDIASALNLDSIDMSEVTLAIEDEFSLSLPSDASRLTTIHALVAYIEYRRNPAANRATFRAPMG